MRKNSKGRNSEERVANCKRLVTIDKLEITARINKYVLDTKQITDDIELQLVGKAEAVELHKTYGRDYYSACYKVFYKNIHTATVFYNEYFKNKNNCVIVFKNWTFYTEFNALYKTLISSNVLRLKDVCIKKVDIAIDVNANFLNRLSGFYTKYRSKKASIKGGTRFTEEIPNETYYVGANKQFCIYDKMKQLKDSKNKKPYIIDYYKDNDFNLAKGVTRVEMRLERSKRGIYADIINNIDLERLDDTKYLNSIISDICNEKLWVVYNDHKNCRDKTRKRLINIDFTKDVEPIVYAKSVIKDSVSISTLKSHIKKTTFDWLWFEEEDAESITLIKINKILQIHNLTEWYENYTTNGSKFYSEYKKYIAKFWEC